MKILDKLWSQVVRERDKGCIICGNPNTQSHHIFSRRYISTRWDLLNGVSLCYPHHIHFAHSKYEEFRDKIIEILGEEIYQELKRKSRETMKYTKEDLIKIKDLL